MQPNQPPPDDLDLAPVPSWVKFAGGALLTAGVFGGFHALQLLALLSNAPGVFAVLPAILAVLSIAAIVLGIGFARARSWSPWAAVIAAGLLWIASAAWFVFAFVYSVFTFFGLLVPFMAFAAFVVTLLGRKQCETSAGARKRLEQQGLEFGV